VHTDIDYGPDYTGARSAGAPITDDSDEPVGMYDSTIILAA